MTLENRGSLAAQRAAGHSAAMPFARPSAPSPRPAQLARWLLGVALLVFMIVAVGGITRLTESGLSITEWKPVTGTIPPLTEAAWQAEFEAYKRIPEYQLINKGMSLAAFKNIYFWEYVHRLLGRIIGLALALPFAWFWWRRAIPPGYAPRLAALVALVGLQGAIGWWMVSSGLAVRTDVSHFRLATHLLTALLLFAGLIWTALDLRALPGPPSRITRFGWLASAILFVQLLFGAFTAGLNAGYVASDWPLMNGHFFPEGVQHLGSAFATIVNDPFLIHFIHRWWAWITVIALVMLAHRAKRIAARRASVFINAAGGTQILLGIATVMSGMNLWLAVLHQAVGALVVAATTIALHAIGRGR